MKIKIITFTLLILIFFPVCSQSEEVTKDEISAQGIFLLPEPIDSTPFDFTLKDLEGINRSLSSYKGKFVFLNFWATWCGPCRKEMPSMQRLYDTYKDSGLEIIAVNLQESNNIVKSFIDELNLDFTVLLDKTGEVGAIYGAANIPTTYLIDRDGNIFAQVVGSRDWNSEEMSSIFEYFLNQDFSSEMIMDEISYDKDDNSTVKEVEIVAFNWGFDISPVTINRGDLVRLRITSREGEHGFFIPEFNINLSPIRPGEEKVIEFVADDSGIFPIICNKPCGSGHRNMTASLTIEE